LSAIFYYDSNQKNIAQNLKSQLEKKGLHVKTKLLPIKTFWRAEEYHQDYYGKTEKMPYCHHYVKRF
jgi:peptide methionine sulfoxide reductase msrA/msrB